MGSLLNCNELSQAAKTVAERPYVTLQVAQTLDGKIALDRKRTRLSSREGLETAHRARSEHDAVLVGSSTVRIDNPELTVRYCCGRQPRRIVLATRLDLPTSARVFAPGPGIMVVGVENAVSDVQIHRLEDLGASVHLVPASPTGLVSLPDALRVVHQWGVRRLLVEGGAEVLTAFLRERLVDEVVIEIVPVLLGAQGVSSIADIGVSALGDAPKLSQLRVTRAGSSILVHGRLA
jgi:riboflavin-specific deaminase-like protein